MVIPNSLQTKLAAGQKKNSEIHGIMGCELDINVYQMAIYRYLKIMNSN